jgi:hypothetical protein
MYFYRVRPNSRFLPIVLFFVLVLVSCDSTETVPETYVEKFYENQQRAEQLVSLLKGDKFLERKSGQELGILKFNDTIRNILTELDIKSVHYFSWGRNDRQFDFITNWRKENPIHITYNSLDGIETQKGFYRKDENSNEVWGLGKGWLLWLERKLLDPKQ